MLSLTKNSMATLEPSRSLHRAVLGAFTIHGSSLTQWCRENDVPLHTARAALLWSDDADARALRRRVIRAAGLSTEEKHTATA